MPDVSGHLYFGLDQPDLLLEATQLCPALFGALAGARSVDGFPMSKKEDLRASLERAAEPAEGLADSIDLLPEEFLPIDSRVDLVRKLYIAQLIYGRARGEETLQRLRSGEIVASHPLPEGW